MSDDHTFSYHIFWRDSRQPLYQNLILTLNGIPALALLTCLGAVITATQPSWWRISRYLLIKSLRPIQLPAAGTNLNDLSQMEAVSMLITGRRTRSSQELTYVSPLFGLGSLVTAVLFLIFSAVIPYSLTTGSGTVLTQRAKECYGLRTYSPTATRLAQSFYGQCQVNFSVDAETCTYPTNIIPTTKQPVLSLQGCPFPNASCVDGYSAFRMEHIDLLPSDYGMNGDGLGVTLGHRVTCAPVQVRKIHGRGATTVIWVGYPPQDIDEDETRAAIGETRVYNNTEFFDPNRRPFNLQNGTVFDLIVYSMLDKFIPGTTFENFHPNLRSDNGDVSLVLFRNSVVVESTPTYSPMMLEILQRMRHDSDHLYKAISSTTTAVGCVEQYQQCFDDICTGWHSAYGVGQEMVRLVHQARQKRDLQPLHLPYMIMLASSIQYILNQRHLSPMVISSYLMRERTLSEPQPGHTIKWTEMIKAPDQWKAEVKAWFHLAFLTTKYSLLTSAQGERGGPLSHYPINPSESTYEFRDSGLLCDKMLLLDTNYTSINLIGLIAALMALILTIIISHVGTLIALYSRAVEKGQGALRNAFSWFGKQLRILKWVIRSILGRVWVIERLAWTSVNGRNWWFRSRRRRGGRTEFVDDTERPGMNVPLEQLRAHT